MSYDSDSHSDINELQGNSRFLLDFTVARHRRIPSIRCSARLRVIAQQCCDRSCSTIQRSAAPWNISENYGSLLGCRSIPSDVATRRGSDDLVEVDRCTSP